MKIVIAIDSLKGSLSSIEAANAIKKGMPIEEVQALLGHAKIETTMIYCTIATENVKHSHHKFMCS